MIPAAYILEWREKAPWEDDGHVEHDLILSRALVEIFSDSDLANRLIFRGGTVLHKLFFSKPLRYSEDIDLVHIKGGKVGGLFDGIRKRLDPWLGEPKRCRSEGNIQLLYRYNTEMTPVRSLRLKVEVNTSENFHVLPIEERKFQVKSEWFTGMTTIYVYALEELMGTKFRALYQRRKGRDLFDLGMLLKHYPSLNRTAVLDCFNTYMKKAGRKVSRAEFEKNMATKIKHPIFNTDISPLLAKGTRVFDLLDALRLVQHAFIEKLPGEAWAGESSK